MLKIAKKALNIIFILIFIFLVYTVIGGILIYLNEYELTSDSRIEVDNTHYYNDEIGPDRVTLLEEGELALTARVNLIENAEESIKIANFKFETGEVTDNIYALLLEAADNGIKVQLLMDGLAHNLQGPANEYYWAIATNPNIEIRFYEPLDLIRPWRLNNRLHDKIILIDNEIVLTGGRNLADSYYLKDDEGRYAYDRDIIIFSETPALAESVINDYIEYYDELWTHHFTQKIENEEFIGFEEKATEGKRTLFSALDASRNSGEFYLEAGIDWRQQSYPTQQITLVTNPIQRMKKDPIILQTLNALMQEAEDLVIVQSPYMIWNNELQDIVHLDQIEADMHFLTNSETSSDNYPGIAGFLNLKDELAEHVTQIYGFQGNGSIHGKSYVIDNRLSLVGSFNFDPRSSFLSTESLVVIDSEPFATALSANIADLMEVSRIYKDNHEILPETVEEADELTIGKRITLWIVRVLVYPFDELL